MKITTDIQEAKAEICQTESAKWSRSRGLRFNSGHIERLVFYARNPSKNDAAVDRMCSSHPRVRFQDSGAGPQRRRSRRRSPPAEGRAQAAGITEIPVILCDEWTPAQVKAFRLMVNRSVTWADWDEELLALELQELQADRTSISILTGFDPDEIDDLLALDDEEKANAAPPLPENPSVAARRSVALRPAPRAVRRRDQRGSCRAAARRPQAAADGHRSALRNRAGFGVARSRRPERLRAGRAELHEAPHRGPHRDHDLRRHARRLVGGVRARAEPRGGLRLARIEVHPRGARRPAADRLRASPADHLGQGPDRAHAHALLVSA